MFLSTYETLKVFSFASALKESQVWPSFVITHGIQHPKIHSNTTIINKTIIPKKKKHQSKYLKLVYIFFYCTIATKKQKKKKDGYGWFTD